MTDIIMRTGFLKVTHKIVFQPQTVPKGKALVDANHVCNVEEHRRDGESLWIQAQVIRQASVTSTPYCTKLNINAAREVTSVSCNCVYNKSGKCKHIAAVIYYENHTNSLSKTDQEKQWGKPSARKFAQEKYCKGEYICNLIPQKKKMKFKPFQLDIKNVTEPSPLRVIALEMERDLNERAANQVMNNLLTTVDVMIERENCEKSINSLFSLSEKKPLYKQNIVVEKEFYDFYANNIVLQKNEIINLCCDTVLQSQCDKWFSARSMRITVSKNVHSIKNRNKKAVETLILELLNPKKIQIPSMRYGIEKEEEALKEFQIIYNVKVQKLRVLACKNQPGYVPER